MPFSLFLYSVRAFFSSFTLFSCVVFARRVWFGRRAFLAVTKKVDLVWGQFCQKLKCARFLQITTRTLQLCSPPTPDATIPDEIIPRRATAPETHDQSCYQAALGVRTKPDCRTRLWRETTHGQSGPRMLRNRSPRAHFNGLWVPHNNR